MRIFICMAYSRCLSLHATNQRRPPACLHAASLFACLACKNQIYLLAEPTKMAAVLYTYVDGMVDKRAPYRSDHLDLLKTMTEEGTCLLGEILQQVHVVWSLKLRPCASHTITCCNCWRWCWWRCWWYRRYSPTEACCLFLSFTSSFFFFNFG